MAKADKIVMVALDDIDDLDINARFSNNLDIIGMVAEIEATGGKVQEPVHLFRPNDAQKAERGVTKTYVKVRGYRRIGACKVIIANPNSAQAVVQEASKVPAIIHDDWTWQDAETFVFDHGTQKPLSRSEVANVVFLTYAMGFDEPKIALQHFQLFAKFYIQNPKEYDRISKLTDRAERDKAIKKMCHTPLNLLLTGPKIGPWLRDQILLSHKSQDNLLMEGEVAHFKYTTSMMQEVRAAKTKDDTEGKWIGTLNDVTITSEGITFNGGGENVNKVLTEHILAAKTGKKADTKPSSKTPKQLEEAKGSFRSKVFQAGLDFASGKTSDSYLKLDTEEWLRDQKLQYLVAQAYSMPEFEAVVKGLADVSVSLDKFKEVVTPLLAKV